ncbi:reverse transcriptase, partial [Elysia marginata]
RAAPLKEPQKRIRSDVSLPSRPSVLQRGRIQWRDYPHNPMQRQPVIPQGVKSDRPTALTSAVCDSSTTSTNATESLGNYDSTVYITSEMREDLEWWGDHADKFPVLLSPRPPPVNINTGASKSDWGGVCDGVTTGGLWSKEE